MYFDFDSFHSIRPSRNLLHLSHVTCFDKLIIFDINMYPGKCTLDSIYIWCYHFHQLLTTEPSLLSHVVHIYCTLLGPEINSSHNLWCILSRTMS